jgi:hypothetical protein
MNLPAMLGRMQLLMYQYAQVMMAAAVLLKMQTPTQTPLQMPLKGCFLGGFRLAVLSFDQYLVLLPNPIVLVWSFHR